MNAGSGPCRDVMEYLLAHPDSRVEFECLDFDPRAIAYGEELCHAVPATVWLRCENILRFRPEAPYDLIWSAGVFDYLDDRAFVFLLKRLMPMVADGGLVLIGNFSPENPTRDYMEFAKWILHHRTLEELQSLADRCGAQPSDVRVVSEDLGVNLFLCIGANCLDHLS